MFASASGRAAEPESVGDTSYALPGIFRAPLVGEQAPRLGLALDAGYGYTEGQLDEGAHHRVLGQLALGVAPMRWLEFGARTALRHDRHPDDGTGEDTGTTTDVGLVVRAGDDIGSGFRLGGDVGATFPGSEHTGDSLSSPALDARALFGWASGTDIRFAGFAGYRLDMTEGVAEDRDRYGLGDRLALGASGFDAVLVGLGAIVPLGNTELLGEVSGDLLVGSDAPPLGQSPLRAGLGARVGLSDVMALEFSGTASLSSRPDLDVDSPLIPIEPRFTVLAGVRYRFLNGPPKQREEPAARPPPPPPETPKKVEPAPPPKVDEPPPPPPMNTVRVTVVDKTTGHPLSDAEAELIVEGQSRPLEFVNESTFEVKEVPIGKAELVVRAERLRDWRREIDVTEGPPIEIQVQMIPAANSGQIRGLIRGFDGKGLSAHVHIEPGDHEVMSEADGSFSIDVPPGKYDVEVTLEGYRTQKLKAQVGKDGVIVLNVDMLKEGR